ncbi:citrate synthase [Natrialba magadii ATCC 43099]|uniref:Citrate synthase n=1 Tax=Natrialba magadii (strain ATCC 43099 / DSM 3394 / CCM 3739 / CIP 104546 / IAM 13178 / JCM 8861 / NBRC 102185 / NCIMB 2190 / MS3) TaxID=547559 RepID=D3SXN2_NATMM|nr:citrate/2-methylcitrate synthase [Natrialba magadii]ADD05981.1 citrate synthase [Natrialba magadii ATCC 43099]ELY30510.1 citrate synthase [Natrialba magadii ATCC 43099]
MTPSVFDPGLSFTAVAETGLSEIDGNTGELRIQGFDIEDLAENAAYEEVMWLLFNGRLPTDTELATFTNELSSARSLTDTIYSLIQEGAEEGVPAIDALRMGLGAGSLSFDSEDTLMATRRVVAICPPIIAAYWRYRQGREPILPREDLSHTANFLYMLSGVEPAESTVKGVETYLITIIEHGLNASTFAARIIGSTGSDPFSAATGAVGALKGPRHGGALERVSEMLTGLDNGTDPATFVQERLEGDGSFPGFGHIVYETRDPRAEIIEQAAEHVGGKQDSTPFLRNARQLEAVAAEYFTEQYPKRQLHVTVDYYAAVLLSELDIPPELFTAIFAIGRSAGWMAHYLEQLESETLLRPRTRYVGPDERSWISRSDRYVAGDSSPPSSTDLEGISSILGTLSEPARLEISLILYESAEPLSYSTIRAQSSIEDKGRFNYHLRKLRRIYITNTAAGYSLTDTGRKVVEMLVDDEQLLAQTIE